MVALAGKHNVITVATNMAGRGTDIKLDRESRESGGLHVILTEMHTARRIDRQFIAGRQGDPGSAQMFVSLEDEIVRLYAPKLATYVGGLGGGDELKGMAQKRAVTLFDGPASRLERSRISSPGAQAG